MKPFSFRLESVLNYRKFLEKKALMRLLSEKKAYDDLETFIRQLTSKKLNVAQKCRHAGLKGIHASLYHTYKSFLERIDRDIENAIAELNEREKRVSEEASLLKKESIRRKALETLKDIRFKEYRIMADRVEQKQLDEIVINHRRAKA